MSGRDECHFLAGGFKRQMSHPTVFLPFCWLETEYSEMSIMASVWCHRMEGVRVFGSQVRGKLSTDQEFLIGLLHRQEKQFHYSKQAKCWIYLL